MSSFLLRSTALGLGPHPLYAFSAAAFFFFLLAAANAFVAAALCSVEGFAFDCLPNPCF